MLLGVAFAMSLGFASPSFAMCNKPVLMFMTDWCPRCAEARAFFAAHGVVPRYVDIEHPKHDAPEGEMSDPELIAQIYRGLHMWGVPGIFIDGKKIEGFNEPLLREKLCMPETD